DPVEGFVHGRRAAAADLAHDAEGGVGRMLAQQRDLVDEWALPLLMAELAKLVESAGGVDVARYDPLEPWLGQSPLPALCVELGQHRPSLWLGQPLEQRHRFGGLAALEQQLGSRDRERARC